MRKLNQKSFEDIITYNLRDNGTAVTIFADWQWDRVNRAREYIAKIIALSGIQRVKIWEPGCSAGDIAGHFSRLHDAYGCDVVPAAVAATRERYPKMHVEEAIAETIEPQECDILVLCEFLEHIADPIDFARRWMPLAKYVVIGHPLVGDGYDPEEGHMWAYNDNDFINWFPLGGHELVEACEFPMGYRMVLGWGRRTT